MTLSTALAGGLFDTPAPDSDDHLADLRALVADLGTRSAADDLSHGHRPAVFDHRLWEGLEATGLTRLTTSGDAGPAEVAVVLYGLARRCAAVPLAETDLLAGWLAQRAGCAVPATGPLTVAVGTIDSAEHTGWAPEVPWAGDAVVVVLARIGDEFRVGALDEIRIDDAFDLAGEPRPSVHFRVPAHRLHTVTEHTFAELQCRGAWARCMQMMGALDEIAALTVSHTGSRKQFGRPLSGFQSVQHAAATMAGHIERARAVAALAVAAATEYGFDAAKTAHVVAVTKTVLGRAGAEVSSIAHQLHGALGVTAEYPLWRYTTRLQSWSAEFGTTTEHSRRLGRAVLAAADPWDLVIGTET